MWQNKGNKLYANNCVTSDDAQLGKTFVICVQWTAKLN